MLPTKGRNSNTRGIIKLSQVRKPAIRSPGGYYNILNNQDLRLEDARPSKKRPALSKVTKPTLLNKRKKPIITLSNRQYTLLQRRKATSSQQPQYISSSKLDDNILDAPRPKSRIRSSKDRLKVSSDTGILKIPGLNF